MIALTQLAKAPRHIVLGAWGYDQVVPIMQQRIDEIRGQHERSLAADFPSK
jgi:hypothetical protein